MATLTFSIESVLVPSTFTADGSAITVRPTTGTRERIVTVSGIPDGAVVRSAVLTGHIRQTTYGAETATIGLYDVRQFVDSTVSLRFDIQSNRDLYILFVFRSYGRATVSGQKTDWLTVENMVLTVTYDMEEDLEPDPEPPMVLPPVKTVTLYEKDETDYSHNGLCVLTPTQCTVSEVAGGSYELQMEHPQDANGKWLMLQEERLIKAGIPPIYIPQITMPPWAVWKITTETDLYSVLPSYIGAKSGVEIVRANPSAYVWSSTRSYQIGQYVTLAVTGGYNIYRAHYPSTNASPANQANQDAWWYVTNTFSPSSSSEEGKGQYNPGKIGQHLLADALVYKIADYNDIWMKVRVAIGGAVGYVRKAHCSQQGQQQETTYPAQVLTTQLFRIYNISSDEDSNTVRVSARQISYDLQRGNVLYDCQLEECDPASAIANIQGSMINPDEREIVTDMTEPLIRGNWSFQNPIQALLDPDEGLAGQLKAKVIRNNRNIFILDNRRPRRGPALTYGVNLLGVTWSRNIEGVVTRIIPRAKDGDDYIYLDELYMDSPHADSFEIHYTEVLDSEYSVGQTITRVDGTSYTLSRSDVIEKMLEEVEKRFYVDHCDSVAVSLDVEFLLLGDTEEYRQYRNLQRLNIYDRIAVNSQSMKTTAQVSGYEWDCLAGRYNRITIGQVFSQSRNRIPGYRMASGSVTYSKLAPDLITYIKGGSE